MPPAADEPGRPGTDPPGDDEAVHHGHDVGTSGARDGDDDDHSLVWGVTVGVVVGMFLLAITGDAYWLVLGIALGAVLGVARRRRG